MRFQKKAAIELSVTAIVILILAIVILGLGLGFIRGMFTKVATQFEEQIAIEPEPATPTGSEPLTLSRETLIVHSGDPVALKIGIHNSGSIKWSSANITISCPGTSIVTDEQFNSKVLAAGESLKGTYLFKVGGVDEGTYLCQAKVQHTPKSGPNATKDVTVKVSR